MACIAQNCCIIIIVIVITIMPPLERSCFHETTSVLDSERISNEVNPRSCGYKSVLGCVPSCDEEICEDAPRIDYLETAISTVIR